MNSKYFEYIEVAIESMDTYDTEFTISCVHLQSECHPSSTICQYALLSPKLCKHSHLQKTQNLDFLTGYLRLVHLLVHHVVHLELQGQDVVLQTSTPIQQLSQLPA